jgi:tRNA nucleotidyltransferase (CCA-adding enzyme)
MSKINTTKIDYWEKVVIPSHVKEVWEELASHKDIEVHAVGGAVRDLLLQQGKKKRKMPTDWDLSTNATPSRIRTIFGARNVVEEENNKKFGVTFVQCRGRVVEVATYREDISTNTKKPDVRLSDNYVTDARRRDFTINACYLDLNGRVHDPTSSGIGHIKNKKLEFVDIADERVKEDPLRLLRGLRFMAMGFKPTGSTKKALFNNPEHLTSFKRTIAQERIRDEILKMMAVNLREVVKVLVDSGMMEVILPEFMPTIEYDQKSDYHMYKLDKHSVETAVDIQRRYKNNDLEIDRELVLIGLLHDLDKVKHQEIDDDGQAHYVGHDKSGAKTIAKIFERLKFSNKSIRRAKVLVENHMALHQQHTVKTLLRLVDTVTQSSVDMRDALWLYKGDLYASRREKSYLTDDYEFPQVQSALKSSDIMKLLESTFGNGYDKKLIGKVQRRIREFYYEFPNIATFKLRIKVKDYIRSLRDNE